MEAFSLANIVSTCAEESENILPHFLLCLKCWTRQPKSFILTSNILQSMNGLKGQFFLPWYYANPMGVFTKETSIDDSVYQTPLIRG